MPKLSKNVWQERALLSRKTQPALSNDKQASFDIRAASGQLSGQQWEVWIVQNGEPAFFLGTVFGAQEKAAQDAGRRWPQWSAKLGMIEISKA